VVDAAEPLEFRQLATREEQLALGRNDLAGDMVRVDDAIVKRPKREPSTHRAHQTYVVSPRFRDGTSGGETDCTSKPRAHSYFGGAVLEGKEQAAVEVGIICARKIPGDKVFFVQA
jgi:hypothetical protein